MLALTYLEEPPCAEVAALIERRLQDVKERLHELKRIDRTLSMALKSCCKGGPDWCNEIERLKGKDRCDCPPAGTPGKRARKSLTLH
jgi:hypothetical protein